MKETEDNTSRIKGFFRDMVVEDEHDEKQKEEAPSLSKWKKITLSCYAVLPVLILAFCMMRLKLIDFSQGEIGYPKLIIHILMLAYILVFQIWVVCKYGNILFPRFLRLWGFTTGKNK